MEILEFKIWQTIPWTPFIINWSM